VCVCVLLVNLLEENEFLFVLLLMESSAPPPPSARHLPYQTAISSKLHTGQWRTFMSARFARLVSQIHVATQDCRL
jgi:hypothetical protein